MSLQDEITELLEDVKNNAGELTEERMKALLRKTARERFGVNPDAVEASAMKRINHWKEMPRLWIIPGVVGIVIGLLVCWAL